MAVVRLGVHELETKRVPFRCLKCGAPAAVWKSKLFFWQPSYALLYITVGYAAYLAFGSAEDRHLRVLVPLCRFHRHHWVMMRLLTLGSLTGVIAGLYFGMPLLADLNQQLGLALAPSNLKPAAIVSGLLGWGMLAVFWRLRTIRPREITDRSITLAGVAPEFKALHKQQGSQPFPATEVEGETG